MLYKDNISINDTKSARALKLALHELLQVKEFTNITVGYLCQEAGVSRSSFYKNFLDKYDLMEKYLEDIFSYVIELRELTNEDEFISKLITFIYDNRDYIRNSFDISDSELASIHIKLIESNLTLISQRENKDIDTESDDFKVKLRFITGGLLSLEHSIINHRSKLSKDAIVDFAIEANKLIKSIYIL